LIRELFGLDRFSGLGLPTYPPSHPDISGQWLVPGFRSLHGCGAAEELPYGLLLFPDFQPKYECLNAKL